MGVKDRVVVRTLSHCPIKTSLIVRDKDSKTDTFVKSVYKVHLCYEKGKTCKT